ncbi:hypothetical protein PE066_19915 [Ramlibacter tataouinensis]|uniref:hypothetical protein n=1 Tax=Ramlibacter tataouinensis TaxID=94132 RepID=UPI0022F3BD3C|nr:hypothetical protein [Ramlibacter tataouinensis]WBY01689.1 hypothetical protein PE066_19915 [Ramlibacter tataouinensis]
MVQKIAVYRKSARGSDALATRDPALSMRLRSLLIMVDGKRSADELARLSAAPAEMQQLFEQLLQLGMIEPLQAAQAPTGGNGQAPSTAASAERILTLPEAQRAAVRGLTDLLGPTADELCLRIERARTAQDLLAVLKRAELAIRTARGAQAAAAFMADMQAHRPA